MIKIRGEKLLTTTTEHPFYVKKTKKARDSLQSDADDEEGEWLTAEKLKVGQKVLRSDGKWTRITWLTRETKPTLVYNLEVENNHNYFVGEIGVLSHNCDWSAIKLVGEKGRYLWRDAKGYLAKSGGTAEELAKGFDTLRKQITGRDPSWVANRQVSSDGSYIWTGETRPFIFVISPDGRLFEAPNTADVVEYVDDGLRPIYEKMIQITQ